MAQTRLACRWPFETKTLIHEAMLKKALSYMRHSLPRRRFEPKRDNVAPVGEPMMVLEVA